MNAELKKDLDQRMHKTAEALRVELSRIRTGKASPELLDGIKIDYYGTSTPLNQLANVSTPEMRLLTVQPFDKSVIKDIEKAILSSDLGLTPANDGLLIRIPIPPLNEERRKELVKLIKKFGEDAKIAMRNIRRDGNEQLKKSQKSGDITEDELHKGQNEIQKLTDEMIETVDKLVHIKEQEILEV